MVENNEESHVDSLKSVNGKSFSVNALHVNLFARIQLFAAPNSGYAQCKIAFKIIALKGMHITEMQCKLKHMFTERKMATFSCRSRKLLC